ncbi:MAG: serpin family protein [Clostridium sp.]
MKTEKMAMVLESASGMMALAEECRMASTKNGWKKVNGIMYFYKEGNKVSGWNNIEGVWYYMDSDGAMKRGWLNDNGIWYYLNYGGSMATGWKEIEGTWYYFDEKGKMHTGWLNDRGTWYYLNSDGSMAHDTVIDKFVINSNGACVNTCDDGSNAVNPGESRKNKNYTFSEGLTKFSCDSASMILGKSDKYKNEAYSPISFYISLSILSECADNDTKKDILNILKINNADKLSEECSKLYKKEIFKSSIGMCILACSLWIDDNNDTLRFNEDTLNNIEKKYKADINKGDLQSIKTAEEISRWLSDNTGGLLGYDNPSHVAASDGHLMNIFNTVYFRDRWEDVFDKNDTYSKNFKISNDKIIKVDFMNKYFDTVINENGNGYKSSSLDFKNGHKMIFILPDEGISPYDIINDSNKVYEALNSLSLDKAEIHSVYYEVPKFKFKSELDLNDCAEKMGLGSIFSPNADFSRFAENDRLHVSEIKQEIAVSIDEDGGEAAEFSDIVMDIGCAFEDSEKTYEMVLDRPFIFAIADKENIPLFIGVINNPAL